MAAKPLSSIPSLHKCDVFSILASSRKRMNALCTLSQTFSFSFSARSTSARTIDSKMPQTIDKTFVEFVNMHLDDR